MQDLPKDRFQQLSRDKETGKTLEDDELSLEQLDHVNGNVPPSYTVDHDLAHPELFTKQYIDELKQYKEQLQAEQERPRKSR